MPPFFFLFYPFTPAALRLPFVGKGKTLGEAESPGKLLGIRLIEINSPKLSSRITCLRCSFWNQFEPLPTILQEKQLYFYQPCNAPMFQIIPRKSTVPHWNFKPIGNIKVLQHQINSTLGRESDNSGTIRGPDIRWVFPSQLNNGITRAKYRSIKEDISPRHRFRLFQGF